MSRHTAPAAGLVAVALAAGCTVQAEPGTPDISTTASRGASTASARATGPLPEPASRASVPSAGGCIPSRRVETMTLEQQAGQLVMVGVPADGPGRGTRAQISRHHIGNIMLTGRTTAAPTAIAQLTGALSSAVDQSSTGGVGLWVATDEEGGKVRVLRAGELADMPSALAQSTWGAETIESRATAWGKALRSAGVNVNLAPVLDVVTREPSTNAPIGAFDRQYGASVESVTAGGTAFARGMKTAGVAATAKHFPGLGAVADNTDTTVTVTDHETAADSATLAPFTEAIAQDVPLVMVSSATYAKIDPAAPALFSPKVIGLLRSLGFEGVVITDDVGGAKALKPFTPGEVARRSVGAGVDVLLTVDPSDGPIMAEALVTAARSDPAFAGKVRDSARRVLEAKAAQGLLPETC